MADKSVGELIAAQSVTPTDLFVLEQNGTAKKLTGQVLENWLVSFADGHGGIQNIAKLSTSGLADTYRITLADTTTFDFVVTNGRSINSIEKTSTSGLIDTYTIRYNNGTTGTFTVTNGEKGDNGDNAYVWIKYASQKPTESSHSMGDLPDDWIGIYSGNASTAPTDWKQYQWFKHKGEQGDTGAPAALISSEVTYQVSDSGTIIPSGEWTASVPVVAQGKYLWTRTIQQYNTGSPITAYSVSRMGMDGLGSVSSVCNVSPDADGNVELSASDVGALPTTGGDLTGNLSMGDHRITGLAEPEDGGDAATKGYADTKAALPKTASGTVIALSDASDGPLQGLRIYGRTTQDGAPTPDNPVELVSVGNTGRITVGIVKSTDDAASQTLQISTPNGLPGIPVSSGGNYTDASGQQYIADYVDMANKKLVRFTRQKTFTKITNSYIVDMGEFLRFDINDAADLALTPLKLDSTNILCKQLKSEYGNMDGDHEYCRNSAPGTLFSLVNYISKDKFQSFDLAGVNEYLKNHPLTYLIAIEPEETALSDEELAAYASIHTNRPNTTIYNDAGAYMDVGYYPPDATMRQEDIKGYVDTAKTEANAYTNASVRKAAPRNLLDNSDFRNPVNQRGKTTDNATDWAYAIDRWIFGNVIYKLTTNGITLTPYGSGGEHLMAQYLEKQDFLIGKKITFAVGLSNGNVCIATGIVPQKSDWAQIAQAELNGVKLEVMWSGGTNYLMPRILVSQETTVAWAALYEGEYTAETLPEYRPKGYMVEALNCGGVSMANSVVMEYSLGTSFTDEQSADIRSGKFEKVHVGGYWTINGRKYWAAHADYRLHCGDTELTTHHMLVIPDRPFYNGVMNDTSVTTGAYYGSKMKTSGLADALATVKADFGAGHILTHRIILANAISNGASSGWAWYDSQIDLMNEKMVYGSNAWGGGSQNGYDTGADKSQLALFKARPDLITNRENLWLRDVNSAFHFCAVDDFGGGTALGASDSAGVRPAFLIY